MLLLHAKTGRAVFLGSACALAVALTLPATAFPPYRTTDAETAGARTLEVRIAAFKLRRHDSETTRTAPLSRVNFGIGEHYEVISELEYAIDDHRFGDGALGFKWASLADGRGIGVETLVLVPVSSGQSGSGLESQLLRTWQQQAWRLHLNAGGFYDPRSGETERGWRGSVLAEFPRERVRPGVELFVRDAQGADPRVQGGFGAIVSLERVEIRTGLHIGLTDEAPDLEASVWFSWKWTLSGAPAQ
jgi:hypothetical protein